MLKDFNLVVSTYRGRENDCISELWFFAKELGDNSLDASKTGLPALVVAKTSLDPEYLVEKAREAIFDKPWYFRYILKIVPIQKTIQATLEEIEEAALSLARERIASGETYMVKVRKRLTELSRNDIIAAIAPKIDNKVDLENPDKIIVIEIIGDVAGISVLSPGRILSVQRIRREAKLRKSQEGGL